LIVEFLATYSEGCCVDAYLLQLKVLPTTIENHKGRKKKPHSCKCGSKL